MSKHGGGGFFVAGAAGGAAGEGSVTSNEASAISAQAASAINVVSNAISALSQQNSVEHAALSVRVDTVSQQASVLSQAVSVISQTVSVHSQRFSTLGGGATSAYLRKAGPADYQWEWGSVTAGGVGSVTSAQRDVLSNQISVLSVQTGLIDAGQTEQIWEKVFPGTNTSVLLLADGKAIEVSAVISVTSVEVQTVSDAVTSVNARATSLAQAVSVISDQVSVLSQAHSALSQAHSALSQAVSVASTANSAAHVSLETHASTASAAATSADAHASAASAAATSVDARVNTLSQAVSVISVQVSVLSQAHSVLSQTVSTHSQLFSTLRGGSAGAVLQKSTASDFNWTWTTLAAGAGSATPTSADYVSLQSTVSHLASIVSLVSTVSAGGTAVGLQSVVNALSNRISAIPGGASAPAARIKDVTALICVSTLTAVPSLSVSVSAGGVYRIDVALLIRTSAPLTTAIGFGLRVSPAGLFLHAAGYYNRVSATGHSGGLVPGSFDEQALSVTDSVLTSVPVISTDIGRTKLVLVELVGKVSATGTITPTARTLVITNTLLILPGSFIKAVKIS